MIALIRGTVIDTIDKGVIVDTGALGYAVYTPTPIGIGADVTLYTHLVIRDDAHELYGFESAAERSLFSTLISVSGVGPKTALGMLAMYPLPELVRAIRSGDAKAISLVSGVGKKTAEKVVIDLKDKLAAFESAAYTDTNELVEALLSLGFKDVDIRTTLPSIDTTVPLEQQITLALRELKK